MENVVIIKNLSNIKTSITLRIHLFQFLRKDKNKKILGPDSKILLTQCGPVFENSYSGQGKIILKYIKCTVTYSKQK